MSLKEDFEKYKKTGKKSTYTVGSNSNGNLKKDYADYLKSEAYIQNQASKLNDAYAQVSSGKPGDLVGFRQREMAIRDALDGYNENRSAFSANKGLADSMKDYKTKMEAIQKKLGEQKTAYQEEKTADELSKFDTSVYSGYMGKKAYEQRDIEKVKQQLDFEEYSKKGAAIENPSFEEATSVIGPTHIGVKKINNPVAFAKENAVQNEALGMRGRSVVDNKYSYLTDDETAVYNYLLAKSGEKEAQSYLDTLDWELDRRYVEHTTGKIKDLSAKNELAGAAINTTMSLGGGAAVIPSLLQTVSDKKKGVVRPINPYSNANAMYEIQQAAREGMVADNGEIGTFVTDAALTTGQYLAQLGLLGGAGAVANMSSSAAGQTIGDYSKRDATKKQALTGGAIAGVTEYATEKLQLSKLKKFFGGKLGKEAGKSLSKEFIKSVIEEGGEEAATDVVNYIADRYIMGDKSQYLSSVNQYMANGESQKDAVFHTILDFSKSTARDFALGAASGAMLSGSAIGSRYASTSQLGKEKQRTSEDYKSIAQGVNRDAAAYDSEENAKKAVSLAQLAEKMVERQKNKEDISNYDRGVFERSLYEYTHMADQKQNGNYTAESEEVPALARQLHNNRVNTVRDTIATDRNNTAVVLEGVEKVENGELFVNVVNPAGEIQVVSVNELSLPEQKAEVLEKAATFGTNGAKAFVANYNTDVKLSAYQAAFAAYYESGKEGTSLERTNKIYQDSIVPGISDNTLLNAYFTGENDNKAVITGEQGVEYKQSIEAERSIVDKLASALNVQVEYDNEKVGAYANGFYSPAEGKIYLSENIDRNLVSIFAHEFTHRMQQTAAPEYNAYKSYVLDYMKGNESYDELVSHWKGRYVENNIEITDTELEDELVANATEEFLLDEDAAKKLASENPTLFEKIRDFIEQMIEDIKHLFSDYTPKSKEAAMLREQLDIYEQARDLWFKAASKSVNNTKGEEEAGRNAKESFSLKYTNNNGIEVYETSEETKKLSMSEKKKMLREKIRDEYRGRTVKFVKNGTAYYAMLNKSTVQKGIYGDKKSDHLGYNAKLNAGMDGNYIELAENARYSNSSKEAGKATKSNERNEAVSWDYFVKTIKSDGKYFDVLINVYDDGEENFLYDITLNEKKDFQAALHTGKTDVYALSQGNPSSNETIAEKSGTVNEVAAVKKQQKTPNDIRYSLKLDHDVNVEQLQHEVESLIEVNEELARQLKLTKEYLPRAGDVDYITGKLLKKYQSTLDRAELADNLTLLFKYIQNTEQVDGADVASITSGIAYKVLNASKTKNTYMEDQYSDLKKTIRGTDIKLSDTDKADLERVGGYTQFRKDNFGRIRLVNSGVSVNTFYGELQGKYPEFFPDTITHPADQLIVISDALDAIKPTIENPYGANMEEMAYIVSQEIFDEYFNIRRQKPTFADVKANELDKAKYEHRKRLEKIKSDYSERYRNKVKQMSEEHKQKNDALRDYKNMRLFAQQQRYQEKLAATKGGYRERQAKEKYKSRIRKTIAEMSKWLLNPTEKKHVPKELAGYTAKFLESIDFSSNRLNQYGEPTKRTVLWGHLRDEYRKIAEASDVNETGDSIFMEVDPEFADRFTDFISQTESVRLEDMDSEQLKELSKLVTSMKRTITTANKMIANERFQDVAEISKAFFAEMSHKKDRKTHTGVAKLADKFLNVDMLDSFSVFDELGEAGKSLMAGLRRGFDKKIVHTEEAKVYMQNLLGKSEAKKWSGKSAQTRTFHLHGGELELTPAQLMSLYCLSKDEQARAHILSDKGGVRPAPVVVRNARYQNGKLVVGETHIKKSFRPVRVEEAELAAMLDTLTPEQKAVADGVSLFFKDYTSKWGNEVSMALYGYEKFVEKDYFPIKSDKNYLVSKDGDKSNLMSTLKNLGITKNRVKGANNPIMLEDIFDVYTEQVTQMASYNAFVLPLSDVQKFFNYRSDTGITVKQELERALGEDMKNYIPRFMESINGTANGGLATDLPSRMISNFKAARVGGNLRVVVQQPTAIVRASAMLNPKYLLTGMANPNKKGNWDMVKKYAPIAQWKDYGFFEMDTGRQMKEIFLGTEGISRIKEAAMIPAGLADSFTWGKIWNAVESEISDTRKELKKGSEEYYQAVGERFSEVIDRTQVVDSVFHRSQMMRSDDLLVKTATSFMSEPTKSYNMLHRAYRMALENNGKSGSLKIFGRAAGAFFATAVVNSAVKSIVDMFRHKKEDDEYWDVYKEDLINNVLGEINPIGLIPFAKDILSITQGFEVERMDTVAVTDVVNAATEWQKYFAGNSKYTVNELLLESAKALSNLTGVPVDNLSREFNTIKDNVIMLIGNAEKSYENDKKTYALSSEKNINMYVQRLVDAKFNGDEALAVQIYNDLIASRIDNETLDRRIESKSKKRLDDDQRIPQLYESTQEFDTGKINEIYNELMTEGYEDKWIKSAVRKYAKSLNGEEETLSYEPITGFGTVNTEDAEIYDTDMLYEAYKESPQEYERLIEEMVTSGKKESSLRSAVKSRYNKEAEAGGLDVISYDELYNAYKSGNTYKYDKVRAELLRLGSTEQTIEQKVVGFMNKDLLDAVDGGDTAASSRMIKMLHDEKGKDMSDIRAAITRKFKPLYVDAVKAGNTAEANRIQKMLEELYLYDGKNNSRYYGKQFKEWLKED